jgi:hypothetical protein
MKIKMLVDKVWSINHKATPLNCGEAYELDFSIGDQLVGYGFAEEVKRGPKKKEVIVEETKVVEVEETKETKPAKKRKKGK